MCDHCMGLSFRMKATFAGVHSLLRMLLAVAAACVTCTSGPQCTCMVISQWSLDAHGVHCKCPCLKGK